MKDILSKILAHEIENGYPFFFFFLIEIYIFEGKFIHLTLFNFQCHKRLHLYSSYNIKYV